MKKFLTLGFALVCAAALVGLFPNKIDKNAPVFETENIFRITFYASSVEEDGFEVPDEHMAEMTAWLGSFTIGEKAGRTLIPGTNSVSVEIEYEDGTVIQSGLSAITIGRRTYYLRSGNAPAYFSEIFEAVVLR